MTKKPPFFTVPLKDEIFSSWLTRMARGNFCLPNNLVSIVSTTGIPIWNRDIDATINVEHLSELGQRLGFSDTSNLFSSTLLSYEGVITERLYTKTAKIFIHPAGVHHRVRTLPGMHFCPLCLSEDQQPYYRKHWRLTIHYACTKHGVLLENRCHQCFSPINFHRLNYEDVNLNHCHACKVNLCHADVKIAPPIYVVYQQRIEEAISNSWIKISDVVQAPSYSYFSVLRHLTGIFLKEWKLNPAALQKYDICDHTTEMFDLIDKVRHVRAIEMLFDNKLKGLLWSAAIKLTDNWPKNFLHYYSPSQTGSLHILKDSKSLPFWFHSYIYAVYSKHSPGMCNEEIVNCLRWLKKRDGLVTSKTLKEILELKNIHDLFRKRSVKFSDLLAQI